jgi:hypothetical protein
MGQSRRQYSKMANKRNRSCADDTEITAATMAKSQAQSGITLRRLFVN